MTSLPVLVVEHQPDCPPGWVGEWLAEAGCRLDVRRPYRSDELPATLGSHGGLVVLGGSMDAYADGPCPWLPQVKRLVRAAAESGVPTLGICLGHQLAAVALGGAVHKNPRGQQIGLLEVGWTDVAADDPLFAPVRDTRISVQWNSDIVAVAPPGTEIIAATPAGEIQAARFARTVWGVQSHPEAGAEIIGAWVEDDRDSAAERGVDLDAYVAKVSAAQDELHASWQPLATGFAALVRKGRCSQ